MEMALTLRMKFRNRMKRKERMTQRRMIPRGVAAAQKGIWIAPFCMMTVQWRRMSSSAHTQDLHLELVAVHIQLASQPFESVAVHIYITAGL